MKWSWRICRIAGIDVYVHFTFLFLIGWVIAQHFFAHGEIAEAVTGVVFILALFGIVVLHELGHALAARRYGIQTRDITLLPIGGVARLERMPEEPRQELVVALAGPAVNLIIAASIYAGLSLSQGLLPVSEVLRVGGGFLDQMLYVNVFLAVFNLLPAFPMDGGRVLRALLAMRMDYVRATQRAATIGQAMALLFGLAGFFGNPMLLFIAVFVWLGAAQEAGMVRMRAAMDGIPVERAMITDFRSLHEQQPLARAVEYILATNQRDFPVLNDAGELVGMLSRRNLAKALARLGPNTRVSEVMQRDFATTGPNEMLHTAIARLTSRDCHALPVVLGGRLLGLVTAENVAEVVMVEEAWKRMDGQWQQSSGFDRYHVGPTGSHRSALR